VKGEPRERGCVREKDEREKMMCEREGRERRGCEREKRM
jgi:hypothetical protein